MVVNTIFIIFHTLSSANLSENVSCDSWLVPAIFTALCALIFWFIRDKFTTLTKSDERVESKIDNNFSYLIKETKSIDKRVSRIEGHYNLSLFISKSPMQLTDKGKEILIDSGIKDAADKFKVELLGKIKSGNHTTSYDVQETTRTIFQEFDFNNEYMTKIKEYAFQTGKWGLSDILDVGAIYFRDIALKELGLKFEDIDKHDPSSKKN